MCRKFTTVARCGLALCFLILASASALAQRPLGCDISSYQSGINWTQVTNAGMKFCWVKATQSANYINPYFTTQVSGGRAAGMYVGAYHYATPSSHPNITGASSADTEAAYFWSEAGSYVKYGGGYLVPMLDWEDTGATVAAGFTETQMSQWANEWCNAVSNYAAASGVIIRPVIYTGTWYSVPGTYPGLNSMVTSWPDWIATYNGQSAQPGAPASSSPWSSWNIWQYNDTNTAVAGWTGGDVDVYNGTLTGFVQNFLIGGANAPSFTTNPTNITVAVSSNATFSAKLSGAAPLNFQWLFNGKTISGATSSNYTVVNAQLTNAGGYSLVVTNTYARVPGSTVFLSVIAPPTNAISSILAPANMANWWPAEGNANDVFGTNNATPNNGLSYTNGEAGLAFHFDGSASYLAVNAPTNIPPNWTACMWVNRVNAPGLSATLMGTATNAIKLEQYSGTREVGITVSGVADYLFSPAYSVPANKWTHLAFVATSSAVTLYTNGVLEGSLTIANFPLPRAYIGADDLHNPGVTDYMLGSLDEIQVFKRALTATEIKNIYSAGSAGLVRAPEFTGVVSTNNNAQVQLNLRGLTGKNFTLYGSSNLVNWTSMGAVSNPTGAVQYLDSAANPQKFYRATQ